MDIIGPPSETWQVGILLGFGLHLLWKEVMPRLRRIDDRIDQLHDRLAKIESTLERLDSIEKQVEEINLDLPEKIAQIRPYPQPD